jgi:hypothetical protein
MGCLQAEQQAAACDHEPVCLFETMVNLTALTHYTLIRKKYFVVIDKIKEWMNAVT